MSTSRAESQHSAYGRRRSNTSQSVIRGVTAPLSTPPPPLKVGDSKTLNAWVHEVKDSPNIIFNQNYWPGVTEGDLLRVTLGTSSPSVPGFLFQVPRDEGSARFQLQISIPKPTADAFDIRNHAEVILTKVDQKEFNADHVELVFQDQYLGRNDMWRLAEHLTGQCIFVNQEVTFIGGIAAKIQGIFINGGMVSSAVVTPSTKAIYRSLSAKVTIFIQVCKELWEFAGDGERYYEKIVHSFLPALFTKWKESGTNHTVTIVLISRVYYEDSEVDYAAGPLRRDERGNWYKDFYKVITDLEVNYEWKPTLVSLKNSFWDFQRDILLAHHYHRASLDSKLGLPSHVRLVGHISYAHDGPVLEALHLGLNPAETHYIDRSLSLTGATFILITPGTGYFRVSKQLLRLTTTRMLDQGVVLNLVLLTKQPLHQSPIFSFQGTEPSLDDQEDELANDPLWCDDSGVDASKKKTFWWEPFWLSSTFWDKQQDLPFRQDRFIARAKMHEIQMLGLLEHDVLASIEVPFITEQPITSHLAPEAIQTTKEEADKFDNDIFASQDSATDSFMLPNPLVPLNGFSRSEKRNSQHRPAAPQVRIGTIEESPLRVTENLPDEGLSTESILTASATILSTSPSQLSIRSNISEKSARSGKPASIRSLAPSKGGLAAKFAQSWFSNPFKSNISEPQPSQVVVSGSSASTEAPYSHSTVLSSTSSAKSIAYTASTATARSATQRSIATPLSTTPMTPSAPIRMPLPTVRPSVASPHITAVPIKGSPLGRSSLRYEEDNLAAPPRGSFARLSPVNTPPRHRDSFHSNPKRRSTASLLAQSISSSSPGSYPNPSNPSQPQRPVSYLQSSMARRWHHILPHPLKKHDVKWKALVTPACLPLTVDYFPSPAELQSCYSVFPYDFVVDPKDLKSFIVRPPPSKGSQQDIQAAWALVVMRGMAAVRLAQGFQFVLQMNQPGANQAPEAGTPPIQGHGLRRTASFMNEEPVLPRAIGAADILKSTDHPIFLSMTNEIHQISFTGDVIQVKRYVRRMPPNPQFKYQCLIWPKDGVGYTELSTTFESHGLENFLWNRLDMLVAGYENTLQDSLRYWRTRFVVIPTTEPPIINTGPSGEKLNEEEVRILGIEKLAEQFTKLRVQLHEDKDSLAQQPVRFLPTTLDPAMSVLDQSLMARLDQIHEAGPLKKNMRSDRDISDLSLTQIGNMMKEEEGLIKHYHWHRAQYQNSFIGADFVSWLVKEFRDISSRAQATDWGVRLFEQGLFEHCRGYHPFLDGHYYYRLKGEYSLPMTPNIKGWFKGDMKAFPSPSSLSRSRPTGVSHHRKKRLILSQTMVIDIDPNKRSDQAESVILHHDIIHNPATVFHFELQWIGTTARCIEDQLRQWNRAIDRYGLKLVEAYVTQISDIRDRNAFQSCFPIRFIVPPPIVPDIEKRVQPDSARAARYYFEYALLREFEFVLDVEAQNLYSDQVDVVYSYRRSPFHYSQFVHRSGVAFVQVLDGGQGFLFLTNRLMGPGRMGVAMKNKGSKSVSASAAQDVRLRLYDFCQDAAALTAFYDEQLASLPPVPEDPPTLVL